MVIDSCERFDIIPNALFIFIFFQSRRFVVNVVEYITNREVLSQLHWLHGRIGRSQTWRG